MNRLFKFLFWTVVFVAMLVGCTIKYSFTGASISPMVKTYTVYDFPNRARLVNPTLSDYFAEQLRDKFTRQTSLGYTNDGGDLEFEGSISDYDVKPISVTGDDIAAQNRLTIKIKVKFTNNNDPDSDFETEFSAYADFNSEMIISDVEDTLVEQIVKQIIDDVFNKSVANW
ncbi:MAG TPA: LPS assembly lipoprotein LptE [Prolixibacteraceae bacterium]|nr:LPS assembly lipoprotein LptE [Prolixibacteraceae bacterium]